MAVEPCEFCPEGASGPKQGTPYGICEACACAKCRGFRQYDDRGFLCTGQPFLTATDCPDCKGSGMRVTPAWAGEKGSPTRVT